MQWDRWLKRRSSSARDHLIVSYSPLVKFVAGRVGAGLPASVDPGDLVSSGVLGLIDAIERFDPQRGVKFETFATPRIRGAIYDGLRAARLGAAVGAQPGPRGRAGDRRARGRATGGRRPTTSSPSTSASTATELDQWLSSIASTTVGPLERALDAGAEPRALSGEVPDRAVDGGRGARGPRADARRDRQAARSREARPVAVLRRGPHARPDQPGARRQREPGAADPHQVGAAPAGAA